MNGEEREAFGVFHVEYLIVDLLCLFGRLLLGLVLVVGCSQGILKAFKIIEDSFSDHDLDDRQG